ncbi:MAG: glycogen debranching enzyme GlgX, partial [Bauldia litoralis]
WSDIGERDQAFFEFVRGMIAIRQRHPILRTRQFLHGDRVDDNGTRDVVWFRPDGAEMDDASWGDGRAKIVGLLLNQPDEELLILVNAYHEPVDFVLPGSASGKWRVIVDTATGEIDPPDRTVEAAASVPLEGRTLLMFCGKCG